MTALHEVVVKVNEQLEPGQYVAMWTYAGMPWSNTLQVLPEHVDNSCDVYNQETDEWDASLLWGNAIPTPANNITIFKAV